MFCKNCGQQNADGVKFCGACGSPMAAPATVGTAPPSVQQPINTYGAPVPQKSNGKIIAIVAAVVAAVAVLVVILVVCLGGDSKSSSGTGGRANTPEDVAEDYIVSVTEMNIEEYVDTLSDCSLIRMSRKLGYDEINKDAVIDDLYSEIDEPDDTVEYEIISVERDDDWNDAEDFIEEIEYDVGYKAASEITEACLVEVKAVVDGRDKKYKVYMVLEDGDWKVYD